jgi:two-component system sensor histidine kinase HydH
VSADTQNTSQPLAGQRDAAELGAMVESLTSISSELLESYDRLAARAERMEKELCIANAELENKVAEVEAILETLPVGVVVRDAVGNVERVNRALIQILGGTAERFMLTDNESLLPRHAENGDAVEIQGTDGEQRVLVSRASNIVADNGAITGSIEVFDDRTEIKTLTERVHQMDKMAALGNMAAGVAHEIRNPMNAIKGFADLFQRGREPGTKDYRWAQLISEGVREVDGIITSLLSFSQPEKLALEECDAQELIDIAIAAAMQRTPGDRPVEDWQLTVECSAGKFRGDRIKLRQALRNLISNALDIQPEGGQVHISSHEDGTDVIFLVADAGPGVSPEIAGRLTDPFFTTRAEGTGLGLSLVHTITRLHGGTFEVHPTPSQLGGALFSIQVPKAPLR